MRKVLLARPGSLGLTPQDRSGLLICDTGASADEECCSSGLKNDAPGVVRTTGLIALFGRGPEISTRRDRSRDGGRPDGSLRTAGRAEAAVAWAGHHITERSAYFLSADHVSCWKMRRG